MAYDIGPRIGIDGEAEYRAQMNNIITQTKTLHAEMRAMESAWDKDTSAKTKAAQTTASLRSQIGLQEQRLASCKDMLAQATAKYGENSTQALKWRQAVANAQTELNKLNAELRNTPNQLQAMGADLQATGEKIQKVGQSVTKVGTTLTKTVTAPIVALGTAAVKTASDFDTSMSKVQAVSGATGTDLEQLRAKAREMGSQTKFSASEAADAMNYMAMAGWKTKDMLSGIEGVMDLAAASGEDLATTSDIVTDALTAFGKSADDAGRLADIMAAASSNANTNVSMMGETFTYAATVAGALGITMEDTAVATGLMANAGIKASSAGTSLRTGLSRLTGPTKQAKEAMTKYGIAIKTNDDGSVNLRETMISLREKMGKLTQTEQAAAAKAIFGANAYAGWLAIINGSDDDFKKLTNAVDNSAGAAKSMAETMQDNLGGKITKLKSQVQELGISFGEELIPYVSKGVETIQDIATAFSELDDSEKEQIIKMAAIAAAAGPVIAVAGTLTSAIGGLVSTAGTVISAIGGLAGTLGAATAAAEGTAAGIGLVGAAMTALPVVGIVAGVAAVGTTLYALSKASDSGKDSLSNLSAEMSEVVSGADKSTAALEKASEGVDSLKESSANSLAEVETAAGMANRYADELETLVGKTKRTKSEQDKMKVLVEKLNDIYPDLALAIDDTTGKLNKNTAEIKENIKQLKNQAEAAAYEEIYAELKQKATDLVKKQVEAEMEHTKVLDKAEEAKKRQKDIETAIAAEQEELRAAQENYNAVLADSSTTTDQANEAMIRYEQAQAAVNDGMVTLNGTVVNVASELGKCAEAQTSAEEATRSYNAAQAESEEALESLYAEADLFDTKIAKVSESLGTAAEATDTSAESADGMTDSVTAAGTAASLAADEIDGAAEEIQEAWDKTYESTQSSIMGQKSLFEELEEAETTSVTKMRENLEKHIEAYKSWNSNAELLMSSTEYSTDENFRAMVDHIVSAGDDMAPELQAIVDAYQKGDEDLTALTADYGQMTQLSEQIATTTANATTSMAYGLDEMNAAIGEGMTAAQATVSAGSTAIGTAMGDGQEIFNGNVQNLYASLHEVPNEFSVIANEAASGAASIGTSAQSGLAKGASGIEKAEKAAVKPVEQLPKDIQKQANAAKTATTAVGKAEVTGLSSQKGAVTTASTTLGQQTKQVSTQVNAQKGITLTASRSIGTSVVTGLNGTKSQAHSASLTLGQQTKTVATTVTAQKGAATTAGRGLGTALKTSLSGMVGTIKSEAKRLGTSAGDGIKSGAENGKSGAKSGGKALGSALESGLSSKKGSVRSEGKSVASAGVSGISSQSTSGAYSWGRHLVQNLIDGMLSKKGAVTSASRTIASAAGSNIKHSVPKEGPLKHDDEWGLHLAQNFAKAMHEGIPAVHAQAVELANAAKIPEAVMNPLDVSGKGQMSVSMENNFKSLENIIDPDAIYEAIRAGNEGITIKIGEREFGRVIREAMA